ncbi:MAG: DUF1330 domain-containing protein [Planctomycetes bacterium]|nr:DUF1330 domain-containing protein [Planctomycetota bacterium]
MKGYWIARVRVLDDVSYDRYRALTPAAIAAYGGRFTVRGGRAETVEGTDWPRHVIIEFPSYEQALACYRSEAYQAARRERLGAALADICVVEGVD